MSVCLTTFAFVYFNCKMFLLSVGSCRLNRVKYTRTRAICLFFLLFFFFFFLSLFHHIFLLPFHSFRFTLDSRMRKKDELKSMFLPTLCCLSGSWFFLLILHLLRVMIIVTHMPLKMILYVVCCTFVSPCNEYSSLALPRVNVFRLMIIMKLISSQYVQSNLIAQ